jgi:hypothetical protein
MDNEGIADTKAHAFVNNHQLLTAN